MLTVYFFVTALLFIVFKNSCEGNYRAELLVTSPIYILFESLPYLDACISELSHWDLIQNLLDHSWIALIQLSQ